MSMMNKFQLDGLKKILNSDILKGIYPMLDNIDVWYMGTKNRQTWREIPMYRVEIHLNDDSITTENMYEKEFDPHYLVDYHLRNYLNYLGVDKSSQLFSFNVYSPSGKLLV
jgi:hypothetical protein